MAKLFGSKKYGLSHPFPFSQKQSR